MAPPLFHDILLLRHFANVTMRGTNGATLTIPKARLAELDEADRPLGNRLLGFDIIWSDTATELSAVLKDGFVITESTCPYVWEDGHVRQTGPVEIPKRTPPPPVKGPKVGLIAGIRSWWST